MGDSGDKIIDYKRVFNTEAGRRVLYDMMDRHFFLRPSFHNSDVNELVYAEGQRGVVLRILTLLEMSPEDVREEIAKGREMNGHYNDATHFDRGVRE